MGGMSSYLFPPFIFSGVQMTHNPDYLEKRFTVLLFTSDPAISDFISQFRIYKVDSTHEAEEFKSIFEKHHHCITIFDIQNCLNMEEAVELAYDLRQRDPLTILVVVINQSDFLFDDIRFTDLPIDDYVLRPLLVDSLKEKLIIWTTRYRRRFLSCIDLDKRMTKYQMGVEVLKDLENKLRSIIDFRERLNGKDSEGSSIT